jgi:competence protein ComEA
VTGRQASGIILMSGIDDWLPPEVAEQPQAAAPGTAAVPEDWLPPQMPERTSQPPSAERRRSTVHQMPPEMAASAPPAQAPDAPARERELQKALDRVTHELEETLRETERLRGQIASMQAVPAEPPEEGPEPPEAAAPAPAGAPVSQDGMVNINTAGVDELVTLPGVGRRAAERLVAYREARGPLASLGALKAVEGFNTDRIARLQGRATV